VVHGDAVGPVEEATRILFGGSLEGLSAAALEVLKREIPCVAIDSPDWNNVAKIVEALIGAGMFESKKDAKRAIQQGGFYLNGIRISPDQQQVDSNGLLHGRFLLARKGSKSYALIEVRGS